MSRSTAEVRKIYRPVSETATTPTSYYTSEKFTANTSETQAPRSCMPWAVYAIYGCNIVFIVVGLACITLGAWLRTDTRFRDFLSERYRNAVIDYSLWTAPTLYIFSYLLIVLGLCMCVVAMFGCCGANQLAKPCLIIYLISLFLLLIFTLSSGIYLIYKRDGLDVELSDALNFMVQHYYQGPGIIQEALDHLQQTFRCCGNAGCGDFRIFRQDVPRTCDIRCDGCHYRITHALQIGFSAAVVVFSFVMFCQLVAFSFAIYLLIRRDDAVKVLYYRSNSRKSQRTVYLEPPPQRAPPLTRAAVERHNRDVPPALNVPRKMDDRYGSERR